MQLFDHDLPGWRNICPLVKILDAFTNINKYARRSGIETDEEEVILERLTYLIVEKVGPNVLISYNVHRDRFRAKFDLYSKLPDGAKERDSS